MTSDIAKQVALKTVLGTCVPKPATLHVQMICVTDRVDTAQSAASKIQTSYVGQHVSMGTLSEVIVKPQFVHLY